MPVLLIGHITKEGSIAGPKVLEHIVDAVLQFEGDRQNIYRILRSIKNRFGSTAELGVYEMCQRGLREVSNPSEMFLSQSDEDLSGISIGVTMEGVRAFLIEVQALVSTAAYGTPQLAVICAILSSNVDITIPNRICMAGEVGLSGEVRPVSRIEQRIREAEKLGMETIIIPRHNLKGIDTSGLNIKIIEVAKVEEAFRALFA